MLPGRVAIVVFDGVALFEVAVAREVFGTDVAADGAARRTRPLRNGGASPAGRRFWKAGQWTRQTPTCAGPCRAA